MIAVMSAAVPLPLTPSRKREREEEPADRSSAVSSARIASSPNGPSEAPSTPLSSVPPEDSLPQPEIQPLSFEPSVMSSVPGPSSVQGNPAKRRKKTHEEKEAEEKARQEKRLEREAMASLKQAEKIRKEAEKDRRHAEKEEQRRLREEEARVKREEAEEKRRAREVEKTRQQMEKDEKRRAREAEEQQKEEERIKKERSQMKLNNFFAKKADAGKSPLKQVIMTEDGRRSRSVSIDPTGASGSRTASPSKATQQDNSAKSDYERYFLPFELPSYSTLAPLHRHGLDEEGLRQIREQLDRLVEAPEPLRDPSELLREMKAKSSDGPIRSCGSVAVRDIVQMMNGSFAEPIDLTKEKASVQQPLQLLNEVPMKYLQFREDIRPPYYGTYSKVQSSEKAMKLSRNPFRKELPEANYDYDSEAEWEEPEEGEDIDSDGEEEVESDGEDDMEGFLDDEDAAETKRRMVTVDIEPVSTGLCWENARGKVSQSTSANFVVDNFSDYKMCFLLDPYPYSVDPHSTAYWEEPPKPQTVAAPIKEMFPPRLPLTARLNSASNGLPVGGTDKMMRPKTTAGFLSATPAPPKPAKRMVDPEVLDEFKAAIQGSDMTKIALIEALKKQFPKQPKDAIANTLGAVAARVGSKASDKRWELLS